MQEQAVHAGTGEVQWKISNLTTLLDGYTRETGHHINVNVLNRETLIDAMDHPEK